MAQVTLSRTDGHNGAVIDVPDHVRVTDDLWPDVRALAWRSGQRFPVPIRRYDCAVCGVLDKISDHDVARVRHFAAQHRH